ncbi:MAG: hypothetical protein VB853_06630, partial [Pirellulales bacterium]
RSRTNDLAGASLGYQWFFNESRSQMIWEVGGAAETDRGTNRGVAGTGLRYQHAIGQHFIFFVDGSVAKRESAELGVGGRVEMRVKF